MGDITLDLVGAVPDISTPERVGRELERLYAELATGKVGITTTMRLRVLTTRLSAFQSAAVDTPEPCKEHVTFTQARELAERVRDTCKNELKRWPARYYDSFSWEQLEHEAGRLHGWLSSIIDTESIKWEKELAR